MTTVENTHTHHQYTEVTKHNINTSISLHHIHAEIVRKNKKKSNQNASRFPVSDRLVGEMAFENGNAGAETNNSNSDMNKLIYDFGKLIYMAYGSPYIFL